MLSIDFDKRNETGDILLGSRERSALDALVLVRRDLEDRTDQWDLNAAERGNCISRDI